MDNNDIYEIIQERQNDADELLDNTETLQDDVAAFKASVNNSPKNYVNLKKAIVTTNTRTSATPQPSFTGRYSGLTNADFMAGSVWYILS